MTTTLPESPVSQTKPPVRRREWAPRIWEGCDFYAWMRILSRNRFAVDWTHAYIAIIVTIVSSTHTLFRILQDFLHGEQVRRTPIREAPLFIIGHWRTGTTLLHELLILDERHTYPNTYQCLEPNHFLLSEEFITRWLHFLMPSHRPMDNMAAGWSRPQEDEFALCMMGQPSPYLTIAFPNHPPAYPEFLDLKGISARALDRWKKAFYRLLQHLTYKDPRRLILKSPPHSCRVPVLLELFPDARFVHIVRDPYVVFPSTVHMWKAMYRRHSLHRPTFAGLEEHVLETFPRIYQGVEEARQHVKPGRFHELRYEDLVRDPVGEMRRLYEQLGLGGFDEFLPRLQKYLHENQGYETNRYEITPAQRQEVTRRWAKVIRQYGYDATEPADKLVSTPA